MNSLFAHDQDATPICRLRGGERFYQSTGPTGTGLGQGPGFHGQWREAAGHYGMDNGERVYLPRLGRYAGPLADRPFAPGSANTYAFDVGVWAGLLASEAPDPTISTTQDSALPEG